MKFTGRTKLVDKMHGVIFATGAGVAAVGIPEATSILNLGALILLSVLLTVMAAWEFGRRN